MSSAPPLRTLSIGGAAYDIFLKFSPEIEKAISHNDTIAFGVGKKIKIHSVIETCGGGANNTAVGLARLGCTATFCGIVGADQWGQKMLENLKNEGVDVSSATIIQDETSSFSIVMVLSNGERTIMNSPGVNEHLHDVTFHRDAIQNVQCVYLNRLSDTACEIENDITTMLKDHQNVHLTWNPGGCQLDAGMHAKDKAALLQRTTLLLLNKEEALHFTGCKDVTSAISALLLAGAKNVCVTDGKNGTFAGDGQHMYFCPTVQDAVILDTTGAGDAFGIGATWALLHGESLPNALIAGTLNATSVIGVIGAQAGLLTETQMRSQATQHAPKAELVQ